MSPPPLALYARLWVWQGDKLLLNIVKIYKAKEQVRVRTLCIPLVSAYRTILVSNKINGGRGRGGATNPRDSVYTSWCLFAITLLYIL